MLEYVLGKVIKNQIFYKKNIKNNVSHVISKFQAQYIVVKLLSITF